MADYSDKRRWSGKDLQKFARLVRAAFGMSQVKRVDVVAIIRSEWIWTIKGTKELRLEVLDDEKMGGVDGLTEFVGETIFVRFKRSVWEKALTRDGRSIWTIAHELGHVVLCHQGAARARETGIATATRYVRAFESSERMAHDFARHLLMEEDLLEKYVDIDLVAADFGVSREVARIALERRIDKPVVTSGFADLLRDLGSRAIVAKSTDEIQLPESNVTRENSSSQKLDRSRLRPFDGNKYCNKESGLVSNHLQDGDHFDEWT